jgi:hypothetical protein
MEYKKIQLLGGAQVFVDFDKPEVNCRSCDKKIRFATTAKNGKNIPIIKAGEFWQAHFVDCPGATSFRRMSRIEEENKNQNELSSL